MSITRSIPRMKTYEFLDKVLTEVAALEPHSITSISECMNAIKDIGKEIQVCRHS